MYSDRLDHLFASGVWKGDPVRAWEANFIYGISKIVMIACASETSPPVHEAMRQAKTDYAERIRTMTQIMIDAAADAPNSITRSRYLLLGMNLPSAMFDFMEIKERKDWINYFGEDGQYFMEALQCHEHLGVEVCTAAPPTCSRHILLYQPIDSLLYQLIGPLHRSPSGYVLVGKWPAVWGRFGNQSCWSLSTAVRFRQHQSRERSARQVAVKFAAPDATALVGVQPEQHAQRDVHVGTDASRARARRRSHYTDDGA